MHIGLIGGIGPAATDYYYRGLIRALAGRQRKLDLTIAHADAPTLLKNLEAGDEAGQAAIFLDLVKRLQAAGASAVAVTSIAGHFCIDALKRISPVPVIDLVTAVDTELAGRKVKRVGLIGTDKVMRSRFYGGFPSLEIVVPAETELESVHKNYVEMAVAAQVTDAQRQVFFDAGRRLCADHGAEAVLLGGTDLFLAFDGRECGFELIDCAAIHIAALAELASNH